MNPYLYWLSPIVTIALAVFGFSSMHGVLKATVENVKAEVDRLRDAVDRHETLLTDFREEVRVQFATAAPYKNGRKRR